MTNSSSEDLKTKATDLLGKIRTALNTFFDAPASNQDTKLLTQKIPFLDDVIENTEDSGKWILQLIRVTNSLIRRRNGALAHQLTLASFGLLVFDFFRIPLIYLAAYLLNEKIPFTLTNKAKWLYSAMLLGLTLTALLVPPFAFVITVSLSSISLVLSFFLLGHAINDYYRMTNRLKIINTTMSTIDQEIETITKKIEILQRALEKTDEPELLEAIYDIIQRLDEQYQHLELKKELYIPLENERVETKNAIQGVKVFTILDRVLAVNLSMLAMIGLIVSLFFPPVGFAIMMTASIIGLTYTGVRLGFSFYQLMKSPILHNTPVSPADNQPVDETHTNSTESILNNIHKDKKFVKKSIYTPSDTTGKSQPLYSKQPSKNNEHKPSISPNPKLPNE